MQDAVVVSEIGKTFDPAGFAGLFRPVVRRKLKEPVVALDRVSLTVRRNEIFGVVGSNGCGKSTLARIVATLLMPNTGSVEVFGMDVVRDTGAVRRVLNRVSVDPAFFKKLSPLENLMFTARLYGLSPRQARLRVFEILEQLRIPRASVTRPMDQMSRGMQQKVAVARGLLTSPVLLVLDEPTTGLDPRSRRDVQAMILEMQANHDATLLLMTHDMDEAERLCQRLAVMEGGRILAAGPPESLRRGAETLEQAFMRYTGHQIEPAGGLEAAKSGGMG